MLKSKAFLIIRHALTHKENIKLDDMRKLIFENGVLTGCDIGFDKDEEGHEGVWCTDNYKQKYFIRKGETPRQASQRAQEKRKQEFWGEDLGPLKGNNAIDKLLLEKHGHIKNAFYRKEIGGIDLVWGDDNSGLQHIIRKRDKLFYEGKGTIKGVDMARLIPELIEKGVFSVDEKGRKGFENEKYRVCVREGYFDINVNWIVTSLEKIK